MPDRDINAGALYGALDIVTALLAAFQVLIGSLILVGGPTRWEAPAWQTASRVWGAPYSIGWVGFGIGVVLCLAVVLPLAVPPPMPDVVRRLRGALMLVASGASAMWWWSLATMFGIQLAVDGDGVGNLGPPLFTIIGALFIIRAGLTTRYVR